MEDEDDEPYCVECGSEDLAYEETTAEADHYRCRVCGSEVSWPCDEDEDDWCG